MQLQKTLLILLAATPAILAKKGGKSSSSSSSSSDDGSSSTPYDTDSSSSSSTTTACASCGCYMTTVKDLKSTYPELPLPLFGSCEETCPFDKTGTPIAKPSPSSSSSLFNSTYDYTSSSLLGREDMPAASTYEYIDCLDGNMEIWATTLKDSSKRKENPAYATSSGGSGNASAMNAAGRVAAGSWAAVAMAVAGVGFAVL